MKRSRLEGKAKRVEESPHFDKTSYFRGKPHLAPFVADIYVAIETGKPLPAWAYRRGIDDEPDELLDKLGVIHLHLGSQSSSELLYLWQFEDHVVFLEISSHKHFHTDPPGTLLKKRHETKVAEIKKKIDAEKRLARTSSQAAADELRAKVRKSLGFKD